MSLGRLTLPSSGRALVLIGVAIAALGASGCVLHTPHLDQVAHSLDRELPDTELDQQFGVKLGRISMGLGKSIARMAMDEDDAQYMGVLSGLKRVEVASYEATGPREDTHFPKRMEDSFRRDGWETLARFQDDSNLGWVLYRIKKESLRNLLVVNLDDDQLNMIRISGRLDQTIKAAMHLARGEMEDLGREWQDEEPEWDSIWEDSEDSVEATGETRADLH